MQCRILTATIHHTFCQPISLSDYKLIHLFLLTFLALEKSNLGFAYSAGNLWIFLKIFTSKIFSRVSINY